jgi:hypothetical protein
MMNLSFGSLYWYANWKGLLTPDLFTESRKTGIYSLIGIVGLVLAIPLAMQTLIYLLH